MQLVVVVLSIVVVHSRGVSVLRIWVSTIVIVVIICLFMLIQFNKVSSCLGWMKLYRYWLGEILCRYCFAR